MTTPSMDPDPDNTPGLEPGGGVPPGETPPGEGSTSEAGPQETHNPPTGWAKAPMTVMVLLTLVFVALFIAMAVVIARI
ncbi:DUF6480 family protein [Streptomyces sp. NPDC029704]|uniref:DUF6480 family protein n=1 Tax=Streptomyces sp. NPDC029704 TaxID=3156920 RepID=UPI0033DFBEED